MELQITEILQDSLSESKETFWLKCKTATGKVIAFWGEFGAPNRNIVSLRHQKLPVTIEIINPENCSPTKNEISKYGLSYSVPSDIYVQIRPEI